MNARLQLLYGLLVALLLGGCSSSFSGPPLQVWQSQVQEYIEVKANGDPSALRNTRDKPSEMAFDVISANASGLLVKETRTDVNGVVLGHRRIDDNWWFIFLVGVVNYEGSFSTFPLDNPQLETVRLMALMKHGDACTWLAGGPDPEALALYEQGQLETWRDSHPDRTDLVSCETVFPTSRDQLHLDVTGNLITVVDEHTGAHWTLTVNPTTIATNQ
ncbi:MAG: hypothetical protein HRT46_11315 [Deltaproteobacteria bacterium]|jgi:hypothetical protein|nr:hypothetical protein [Deltaproteobacteria bacterium]